MKNQYIKDLKPGDAIKAPFLTRKISFGTAQNDTTFARLTLRDNSGDMEAKWFGIGEAQINLLNNSEYLMVCGKAEQRGNEVQAKITYAEAYDPNGTESEYQPLSFQPLDFLQSSLDSYIDSIKDPDIKELLRAFFVYDQQMRQDYEEFPASISNHHGFKHGLLQHSLEVTRQVDFDSQEILRWGKIKLNRDLLIAGALLHDIGKLREYVRVGKSDFTWGEEGQFIGHIVLGFEMLCEKIMLLDYFPNETAMALKHIVLSHHGKKEFGSPVTPYFYEAELIAKADEKSAAAQHWIDAINTEYADGGNFQLAQKLAGDTRLFPRRVYVGDNVYSKIDG